MDTLGVFAVSISDFRNGAFSAKKDQGVRAEAYG